VAYGTRINPEVVMADNTLILDEKEYNVDDLTEPQQYLCSQIRDLKTKQDSFKFQQDQLAVGLKGFVDKLRESLE
tara:strand:+ start:187 stop:411 length:225 start_codon:yes stop_codon:yes gene_type:complete